MQRPAIARLPGQEDQRREKNRFRNQGDINKMYTHGNFGRTWRMLAPLMRVLNPICTKLHDGVQCRNAATITHHLISPRTNPRLFLVATNLTTLCAHCHPDDDTPNWRIGVDFIQPRYPKPYIGPSEQEKQV